MTKHVPLDAIVAELFELLAAELPLHVVTGPIVRKIEAAAITRLDDLVDRLQAKGHAVVATLTPQQADAPPAP